MINVNEQIDYWELGAKEELLTATVLFENKRIEACLFYCHLCLEKILKAIYVKVNEKHPPKTHNLKWLLDNSQINVDDEQLKFILIIQLYQSESRYPNAFTAEPDEDKTMHYLQQTKTMYIWFKAKL